MTAAPWTAPTDGRWRNEPYEADCRDLALLALHPGLHDAQHLRRRLSRNGALAGLSPLLLCRSAGGNGAPPGGVKNFDAGQRPHRPRLFPGADGKIPLEHRLPGPGHGRKEPGYPFRLPGRCGGTGGKDAPGGNRLAASGPAERKKPGAEPPKPAKTCRGGPKAGPYPPGWNQRQANWLLCLGPSLPGGVCAGGGPGEHLGSGISAGGGGGGAAHPFMYGAVWRKTGPFLPGRPGRTGPWQHR